MGRLKDTYETEYAEELMLWEQSAYTKNPALHVSKNSLTYRTEIAKREGYPHLQQAITQLLTDGVPVFGEGYFSVPDAARNILICGAVNGAAKEIREQKARDGYYALKPWVIAETALIGCKKGVKLSEAWDEREERVWELYHPDVGRATFHESHDGFVKTIQKVGVPYAPASENWSRINWEKSTLNLTNPYVLSTMAAATAPENQGWQYYVQHRGNPQASPVNMGAALPPEMLAAARISRAASRAACRQGR